MAISVGAAPTTNTVTVNTSSLFTMIERANNAVQIGLIQSYTLSKTTDAIVIVVPPNTATTVADHGGASGYNTFANAYFTLWGHTVV